ncbi:MAG: retropepsin-like aspartic protease [Nannocystaceae bacterium]
MKSLIASALSVLGWFVVSLASVVVILVALWITSALARAAQDLGSGDPSPLWIWGLTVGICLGVPFALALWKHGADRRRIAGALAWLPLVWNTFTLATASLLIPDLVGGALRHHGAWFVLDRVGDSHTWTRYLSALGHNTADLVDRDDAPAESAPLPSLESDPEDTSEGAHGAEITVPFAADGNAILMDVALEGPAGQITLPYLFDTGASFTTLSSETARRLGIEVPEDAPTLHFNTASGPRESRMVYLPALRLGAVTLRGLLVSVCDGCTNDRSEGLLGLNVIREFFVHMDYQAARMKLLPRLQADPNRAYDINPAVRLEVEGRPEIWLGRVRWVVEVHNRSTVPIRGVVPEVHFSDGLELRGQTIDAIEPGAVGRSLVEGKTRTREGGELGFTLTLAEATW